MSVTLSHIAIACPEIQAVAEKFRLLEMEIKQVHEVPSESVKAAMLPLSVSPQICIELLEPLEPNSPISRFLEKKPQGGVHHLSFEVTQIEKWKEKLESHGLIVLPPGIRKAARGRALFIHPKCFGGILVELEEIT
jgi:methylmalonyl-CoA/ethylmalonyl-CoA epimerase